MSEPPLRLSRLEPAVRANRIAGRIDRAEAAYARKRFTLR